MNNQAKTLNNKPFIF